MTDLRLVLRQLRTSPGFTFLAAITLGFGPNTTIFSLSDDLFLCGLQITAHPQEFMHRKPLMMNERWRLTFFNLDGMLYK